MRFSAITISTRFSAPKNADHIYGYGGNDLLNGAGGRDELNGGDGDDTLWGGAGNDIIYGGLHDDRLVVGDGINVLIDGTGDDYFELTAGANNATGGTGADKFAVNPDNALLASDIVDFNVDQDILVFNDAYDTDVTIGANASGWVEFTFDGGGTQTLANVQYQNGMTFNDFNIEWN
jgi:Ca2+-binding RTX toxin-like protein